MINEYRSPPLQRLQTSVSIKDFPGAQKKGQFLLFYLLLCTVRKIRLSEQCTAARRTRADKQWQSFPGCAGRRKMENPWSTAVARRTDRRTETSNNDLHRLLPATKEAQNSHSIEHRGTCQRSKKGCATPQRRDAAITAKGEVPGT